MTRSIGIVLALLAVAAAAALWLVEYRGFRSVDHVYVLSRSDSPHEFLKGIYQADRTDISFAYRVRGVIVPHHLVATESIAAGIKMLASASPQRILLLSPDHFHNCPTVLCTTSGTFETRFGSVHAEAMRVGSDTASLVTPNPEVFEKEHGIRVVLPYTAHYLPGVEVVPIVLSQKHVWQSSDEKTILQLLSEFMDEETALVVSSDFSHYLPLGEADAKDEETAQAIFAKDIQHLKALSNPAHSDCPRCLWLLASLAERQNFYNPSVLRHTNSARLLNDTSVPQTTSHFAMAFYTNNILHTDDLALAGDVTLARAEGAPTLSANIQEFWKGEGLRVLNLEGPLGERCSPNPNPYIFCNRKDLWLRIRDLATAWVVENNHMLDQGKEGYVQTQSIIQHEGEGVISTEPYQDSEYFLIALTRAINPVPEQAAAQLQEDYKAVTAALKNAKPDLLKVVYVHAGTEYQTLLSDDGRRFLESFIDAGTDAVIVAHSHVVGDVFIYKNRPIFTGLGNFIFDQPDNVATSTAKMVRLRKDGDKVLFETRISR